MTAGPAHAKAVSVGVPTPGSLGKRALLLAAMTVVAINVWTGGPLFSLWVGSRLQTTGQPLMASAALIIVILVIVSFVLVRLLTILSAAYDRASGQTATVRTHAPWLRSMRGERERYAGERPRLTALERILVAMVIVVVLGFEIWFFFFSTSPIDERTGRSSLPATSSQSAAMPPSLSTPRLEAAK